MRMRWCGPAGLWRQASLAARPPLVSCWKCAVGTRQLVRITCICVWSPFPVVVFDKKKKTHSWTWHFRSGHRSRHVISWFRSPYHKARTQLKLPPQVCHPVVLNASPGLLQPRAQCTCCAWLHLASFRCISTWGFVQRLFQDPRKDRSYS